MTRFDTCLAFVLDCEGGYVDDPYDRGGATNCGITQREYSLHLAELNLPDSPVKHIHQSQVAAIYKIRYWDAARCGEYDIPLDLVMFDTAVNHGVSKAVKMLQQMVHAEVDGVVGPETITLTSIACSTPERTKLLALKIAYARQKFYGAIVANDETQRRFLRGWLNRLDKLQDAADLIA